jgi:hypothetical protein
MGFGPGTRGDTVPGRRRSPQRLSELRLHEDAPGKDALLQLQQADPRRVGAGFGGRSGLEPGTRYAAGSADATGELDSGPASALGRGFRSRPSSGFGAGRGLRINLDGRPGFGPRLRYFDRLRYFGRAGPRPDAGFRRRVGIDLGRHSASSALGLGSVGSTDSASSTLGDCERRCPNTASPALGSADRRGADSASVPGSQRRADRVPEVRLCEDTARQGALLQLRSEPGRLGARVSSPAGKAAEP